MSITQGYLSSLELTDDGLPFFNGTTDRSVSRDYNSLDNPGAGKPFAAAVVSNTYYVDLEGGDDTKDGLSYANRVKTTSGLTLQPGDNVRIMASPYATDTGLTSKWFQSYNMGSQSGGTYTSSSYYNVTAITNASPMVLTVSVNWGSSGKPSPVAGDIIVVYGTSDVKTCGVWKVGTVGSNTLQLLNADGTNSDAPGAAFSGSASMMIISAHFIELSSPVTKNLWCGVPTTGSRVGSKVAWTSAGVPGWSYINNGQFAGVSSENADGGQFTLSGFTSGKIGYVQLSATNVDLSAYQQLNLWITLAVGAGGEPFPNGWLTLNLCSDLTGDVPVNSFSFPGMIYDSIAMVLDYGSALSSTVRSLSFVLNVDLTRYTTLGTPVLMFNNIFVSKAPSAPDCITLRSMVSKNTPAEPEWYGIRSIDANRIQLKTDFFQSVNTFPGNVPAGFPGTVESAAKLWVRQAVAGSSWYPSVSYQWDTAYGDYIAADSKSAVKINAVGTEAAPISITGGWDRTSMSSQVDVTAICGLGQSNWKSFIGWDFSGSNHIYIDRLTAVGFSNGLALGGPVIKGGQLEVTGCFGQSIYSSVSTSTCSLDTVRLTFNGYSAWGLIGNVSINKLTLYCNFCGLQADRAQGSVYIKELYTGSNNYPLWMTIPCTVDTWYRSRTDRSPISSAGGALTINSVNLINDVGHSVVGPAIGETVVNNISASNSRGVFDSNDISNGYWYGVALKNLQTTNVTSYVTYGTYLESPLATSSQFDGTSATTNKRTTFYGLVQTQTGVSLSGLAWQLSPTTTACTLATPLTLPIARVGVQANSTSIINVSTYRDNAGLTLRVRVPKNQLGGLTSDAIATCSTVGSWETLTLSITPTESGVVEVIVEAYGGTTYNGYVDNLTLG